MRRGCPRSGLLLCAVLGAVPAGAAAENRPDVWARITDPNGEQVRSLVLRARLAMSRADDATSGDLEWAVEARARFYRDAYHLTAYARTLAPANLDALAAFAAAADELGKPAEALAALERYAALAGADHVPSAVAQPLGAIYLRTGDRDRALRWLRVAQGGSTVVGTGLPAAHARVLLATALAGGGDVAAALHTLASALPDRPVAQYSPELTIAAFALAVLYDRDEQRGAAFEVLEHMQSVMEDSYLGLVQTELARMRFVPAEDRLYYRALLYESRGLYIEARAEWAHYAASGGAYRGRALDHIAAIDAQRRANPRLKPAQQSAPPRAIPRRLPRP